MHYNLSRAMDMFLQAQDPQLSKATIDNKRHYIGQFLEFLEKQEYCDFNGFDINLAYEFVESLDYASQTLSNVQFAIRNFFDALHNGGMSDIDGRMVFPIIFTNKRDRILSYYQPDEIKSVINAIDTSRPNGVRDKCWVLLAAQTGLRSSDILQLMFDEILWDKHVISKKLQKTGLPVTVALPENIELLLIDMRGQRRKVLQHIGVPDRPSLFFESRGIHQKQEARSTCLTSFSCIQSTTEQYADACHHRHPWAQGFEHNFEVPLH